MKKININLFAGVILLMLVSCKDKFIEIEPKGQFLTSNYYQTEAEAFSALVGVYDVLRKNSGGFENMITMMDAGSDDHLAGGGGESDGNGIHDFTDFTINANTMPGSFWNDHYQGIFKANTLLEKIPSTVITDVKRDRFVAEAKALRAVSYFNLVRLFKNVPLLLKPLTPNEIYGVTQAKPEDVYAQIEKDLTEAIAALPATVPLSTEAGRFTKGAAQAVLGKVYLYQNKNAQAAAQFAEVNGTPGGTSQYGYKLLSNFRDLWVFSNKYNTESILEAAHSSAGNSDWGWWGSSSDEGNTVNQMVGPRSYEKISAPAPDMPSGWSFIVFTEDFYSLIKTDPRFSATVFDMKAFEAAGHAKYVHGFQNTGYFVHKFLPKAGDVRTGGGSLELNFQQNSYIIRLADTYLMEAEALGASGSRAQALLDAVRARVGLPSVPVNLLAIKKERRLELAAEGHRFFDLVRWGDAASVLGPRGFVAGKHEILPIPAFELQGTLLKQNPNYN